MGASSVTGTGPGAAEVTRGPGNGRGQYSSLVDPHIVWHGTATLSKGSATVYLPSTIQVPPTHLTILVGGFGYAVEKVVTNDIVTAFVIEGYGEKVDYIVIDANNSCFCEYFEEPV